jgi:hypothetical protein
LARLEVVMLTDNQHWLELCDLAVKERDPKKLLALVRKLNRLIEEDRLKALPLTQARIGFRSADHGDSIR